MATTNVELLEGTVTSANDRGFKLAGHDAYLNYSKFREVQRPDKGQTVRVEVDEKGFINSLVVVNDVNARTAPTRDGMSAEREGVITRLAALKAAAEFGASRGETMKSSDVLLIADRWARWAETGELPGRRNPEASEPPSDE